MLDALGFDWNDPELLPITQYRVEAEPNSAKSNATLITGFTAGQALIGTTNGSNTALTDATIGSVDDYRLRTGALPLRVYRHTLTLGAGGALVLDVHPGSHPTERCHRHDGRLRQSGLPSGANITSSWYGFGKQEEIFYQVVGSGSSTLPYTVTLSTATIAPIVVPGTFFIGPITVSSVGVQSTDTEIYVYDSNLNPVPLGHNDDPLAGGGAGPSIVTVTLSAGRTTSRSERTTPPTTSRT
ncbi:MAG: hypothetical protein IPJ19_18745 [Planctomycetes bacterium]|nr:hypothetical protein [Planctomycetota bacterium]